MNSADNSDALMTTGSLMDTLGTLVMSVDHRKNGKVEAGLGTLGSRAASMVVAHASTIHAKWCDSLFIETIHFGFSSLSQDYRISRIDQELMQYAYIRLREEAGLNPLDGLY